MCIVLLALPFFVLRANLKDPSRTNAFDRVILEASAPIQYGTTQFAQGVSALLQEYVYLVDVKRDNDRLRAENAHDDGELPPAHECPGRPQRGGCSRRRNHGPDRGRGCQRPAGGKLSQGPDKLSKS